MSEIVTQSESYEKGSAYGVILMDGDHKDVGYGSGPWSPQTALLHAINMGLAADNSDSHARVHLPRPQIANYVRTSLIERWKDNDWKKLNGEPVEAVDQWEDLMWWHQNRNMSFETESDHPLMEWARRACLCAMAEVPIRSLRSQEDLSETKQVTPEQASEFWMVADDSGYDKCAARRLLSEYGVISAKDLARSSWESVMERASSPTIAEKYNDMLADD